MSLVVAQCLLQKKTNTKEQKEEEERRERKNEKKYTLENETELEEFSKGTIKNANQLREHET